VGSLRMGGEVKAATGSGADKPSTGSLGPGQGSRSHDRVLGFEGGGGAGSGGGGGGAIDSDGNAPATGPERSQFRAHNYRDRKTENANGDDELHGKWVECPASSSLTFCLRSFLFFEKPKRWAILPENRDRLPAYVPPMSSNPDVDSDVSLAYTLDGQHQLLGRGKVWTVFAARYRLPTVLSPRPLPESWTTKLQQDADPSSGSEASPSPTQAHFPTSLIWHDVALKSLQLPSDTYTLSANLDPKTWMSATAALRAARREIALYAGPLKRLQGSVVPVIYDVHDVVLEGGDVRVLMERMGEAVVRVDGGWRDLSDWDR